MSFYPPFFFRSLTYSHAIVKHTTPKLAHHSESLNPQRRAAAGVGMQLIRSPVRKGESPKPEVQTFTKKEARAHYLQEPEPLLRVPLLTFLRPCILFIFVCLDVCLKGLNI